MKETRFIAQNKEKWREAETLLKARVKDPDKLSNLFVQIVDDLSYSRTYYPNRSVRVYLNKIARQYFSIIYSHKKEKYNAFKLFWLDELPQIIVYSKRQLIASLLVFLLAFAIGVFSSQNDPQFASTILGDEYLTMTDKNIQSGDPMAVYKQSHQIDMFFGITFNNLMVAFRTYVLGIFLAIGTLGSLLYNGIMVGCFQYYFVERGLFLTSSLSIWLHGTLEISSIILAGGAGLTLGSGLIFPGTYSRLQSLQRSGIRSLKLMLGITPVFILAAVIESFLTRYTNAPIFLKLLLIVLSALYIIGYFVVYPWLKSKKGFDYPIKEVRLSSRKIEPVNFDRIKNNADLLKDAFQFYARHNKKLLSWAFMAALAVSIASYFLGEQSATAVIESEWWITLFSDVISVFHTPSPIFIVIGGLGFSIVLYRTMKLIDAESKIAQFSYDMKSFVQIFVVGTSIYGAMYLGEFALFALIVVWGFLVFIAFIQLTRSSSLIHGVAQGWNLFTKNNNQGFALQFIVLLLAFSFLVLLSAPLLYIHMSVLQWNFVARDTSSQHVVHFLEIFIRTFAFYLILPIIASSFSYLYFSQQEASNAKSLKESIAKMISERSKFERR
jgi:uncharacterized membrane protein SpoIIM required for sporulation